MPAGIHLGWEMCAHTRTKYENDWIGKLPLYKQPKLAAPIVCSSFQALPCGLPHGTLLLINAFLPKTPNINSIFLLWHENTHQKHPPKHTHTHKARAGAEGGEGGRECKWAQHYDNKQTERKTTPSKRNQGYSWHFWNYLIKELLFTSTINKGCIDNTHWAST